MATNPVDEFRINFFDSLIKEETEKVQQLKLQQQNCFHHYSLVIDTYQGEYQLRACSKCGHTAVRRISVWEGSKACVIS